MKQLSSYGLALLLALTGFFLSPMAMAQNVMPQQGDKISTSDGIYLVSGANLIQNPSFDEGFTGWLAGNGQELQEANFELVSEGGADGGAFIRALGSAGSSSASSIKKGWAVEVGKTYLFSMWANRPSSGIGNNTQYSLIYNSDTQTGKDKELSGVNFKADKELVKQVDRRCTLERGGVRRLHRSPYSREERLALAQRYLDEHATMRIADYVALTGLSRTAATQELIAFRQDVSTGITISGRLSHSVYVKREIKA